MRAPEPTSIHTNTGQRLRVFRCGNQILGFDETESYPTPIVLTPDDLIQYGVNVSALLSIIREKAELLDSGGSLLNGFHFLGRRSSSNAGSTSVPFYLSLGSGYTERLLGRLSLLSSGPGIKVAVLPVLPDLDRLHAFSTRGLYITDLNADLSINWPEALEKPAPSHLFNRPHSFGRTVDRVLPTRDSHAWPDVIIRFLDGHTVSVSIGTLRGRFSFIEMGMADSRTKSPDAQWNLLRQFAESQGTLTWSSRGASSLNQKRKERLAQRLKTFFQIPGDPFRYNRHLRGWECVFTILGDD